jgi:Protein of unknown function (DUF3551)
MRITTIAGPGPAPTCVSAKLGAGRAPRILFWDDPEKQEKRNMIKPASKNFIASAAALFTLALFVTTAPTARADDYCITNGAHAAHGCGYPSMEMCQAASSGIGRHLLAQCLVQELKRCHGSSTKAVTFTKRASTPERTQRTINGGWDQIRMLRPPR